MTALNLHTLAHNGQNFEVASWWPTGEKTPKACVHILHGMGEHKMRYEHFAEFLNAHQIKVYAHDHLGHGSQILESAPAGHFGDIEGFNTLIGNVHAVQTYIKQQHTNLPIFILGHSMGSFIAQAYLAQHPSHIQGLILSGSAFTPKPLLHSLKWIAKLESFRVGKQQYSKIIDFLSFGAYNKAFQPQRTNFDWLSREQQHVDQYIADPNCGFILSTQSWYELAQALIKISSPQTLKQIPSQLPCLIISGDKDPVGGNGKYVKALEQHWLNTGHTSTQCVLVKDARHEVLNETDRELTYNALLNWINENQA